MYKISPFDYVRPREKQKLEIYTLREIQLIFFPRVIRRSVSNRYEFGYLLAVRAVAIQACIYTRESRLREIEQERNNGLTLRVIDLRSESTKQAVKRSAVSLRYATIKIVRYQRQAGISSYALLRFLPIIPTP